MKKTNKKDMLRISLFILVLVLLSNIIYATSNEELKQLERERNCSKMLREATTEVQYILRESKYKYGDEFLFKKLLDEKFISEFERANAKIYEIGHANECKDTQARYKALLVVAKFEKDQGNVARAKKIYVEIINEIEGGEGGFFFRLRDNTETIFSWINKNLLKLEKEYVKEQTDYSNKDYVRDEAVKNLLDCFYIKNECTLYLATYSYYNEHRLKMDLDSRDSYDEKQQKCLDQYWAQDETHVDEQDLKDGTIIIYNRPKSYLAKYRERMSESSFNIYDFTFEENFKDNVIDIYIFNDFTMSETNFNIEIEMFTEALNDLPSYEILGELKNDDKLENSIAFVPHYISNEKNLSGWTQNKILDRCDIKSNEEKEYEIWANKLGADAYIVFTYTECRSWARSGKMSVVSLTGYSSLIDGAGFDLIMHELGHLVWSLRDEYVEEDSGRKVSGKPNCAKNEEEAQILWGDLMDYEPESYPIIYNTFEDQVKYNARAVIDLRNVGLYPGCGYTSDYLKPNQYTIMVGHNFKYLARPQKELPVIFGPINDLYMRKILMEYNEDNLMY